MGRRAPRSFPPIWLLPNLLSLDAPLVALVWQDFLARCTATPLRPSARVVLGLTVWAIYLADRILDVRLPARAAESPRHQFYRNHRRATVLLLAVVLAVDAMVTLVLLRPPIFHNGVLALGGVLLYLAAVHTGLPWRLPKEAVVALLFTTGTFLVAWTWSPRPAATLLLPAIVFFLLCLGNLVAIESWEWRELRKLKAGPPHAMTVALGPWLGTSAAVLAGACLIFGNSPWYRAAGLSAALLTAAYWLGTRIPLNVRRVMVDVVLLTPLLFLC